MYSINENAGYTVSLLYAAKQSCIVNFIDTLYSSLFFLSGVGALCKDKSNSIHGI